MQSIVLGGGCFWCTEAIFRRLRGVLSVIPGYAGGQTINPTYEEVCSGSTGHAEVIRVEFDPDRISLRQIFEVFFALHDPTTLNQQGADVGTQYRSIILYENEEQRATAEQVIQELKDSKQYRDPLVTELQPLTEFYPAEAYHHEYFEKNRNLPYCSIVIEPKLQKLLRKFASVTKEDA